jgi:predicted DNA-binding transcriptional regulator YafY
VRQALLFPELRQERHYAHEAILSVLRAAIAEGLRVRIEYVDAAGVETRRIVRPIGLAYTSGASRGWHLEAWCELREDERNFVLGRIATAELLERRRCAS